MACQKTRKYSKNDGDKIKKTQNPLEGAPTGQAEDNWSIRINNDINGL